MKCLPYGSKKYVTDDLSIMWWESSLNGSKPFVHSFNDQPGYYRIDEQIRYWYKNGIFSRPYSKPAIIYSFNNVETYEYFP